MTDRPPRAAMILAAGLGTRLQPLTDHLAKPLVPILGRPLLAVIAANLRGAGVTRLGVNSHHLPAQVAREVELLSLRDHRCEYRVFHEPEILGTGGALVNARAMLEGDEPFLLHNGDVLTDLDLAALIAAHERAVEREPGGAVATLALVDWPQANTVLLGADGRILDINGRLGGDPARGRALTYSGVAVLESTIFECLPPSGPSSLIDALLASLARRPNAVRGFAPEGLYWNDLGTVGRLLDAHRDLLVGQRLRLGGVPTLALPAAPSPGPVFLAEGAQVADGARLGGFASLGRGARVDGGAELEDCVVLDGVPVPAETRWRRAVLGPGWTITEEETEIPRLPLVRAAGLGEPVRAERLVEQGSDRSFWRLRAAGGRPTVVLMQAPAGDPELSRWLAVARFLREEDLGGPEILARDEAAGTVLMEDLGDDTLLRLVGRDRARLVELYAPVLDLLIELQTRGTADRERCPEAGDRLFDYATARWESDYFRQRFLIELSGVPAEEAAALDPEFHLLAEAALGQPFVLMHRDFQAQNVLIKEGRARPVDFQGMRQGPLLYDVMSLLRDPYVEPSEDQRAALLERYRTGLAARGGPRFGVVDLRRLAVPAGLQRNLQALGAYAFLSRVKGKRQYRRWIPAGLRQLAGGLRDLRAAGGPPGPLPRLEALVGRLVEGGTDADRQ